MLGKYLIKAPAKINLFLNVLGKRKDGFYDIKSGITFINLYDEVSIKLSNKFSLKYSGQFKPDPNIFENDIILKTLKVLNITEKLDIIIKKNIPTQAGLGSASTNAAALIKFALNSGLITNHNINKKLKKIGADVPACFLGRDCLITGIGDKIYSDIMFPKYFFVLIKPIINFSTTEMYSKFENYNILNKEFKESSDYYNLTNLGNDFEKIIRFENNEIVNLLDFLSNLRHCVFSRMSGSGSCCYAVFETEKKAKNGYNTINKKFSNFWTFIGKNNTINS